MAESFLIGSAAEHKALIIEKSPEKIAICDPGQDHIIVTNHFQSDAFRDDQLNIENMENETSIYRFKRVEELLAANPSVSPEIAAGILRDDKGLQGKDIGLGNEKAINQFIAHHSVVFQPEQRRLWVAGPPYQLGEYWCYDLDSVFTAEAQRRGECSIPSDSLTISVSYQNHLKFRALAAKIESGGYQEGDADSLIRFNPEFFHTYRILGDYFKAKGEGLRAEEFYRMALEKEAPSAAERSAVGGRR